MTTDAKLARDGRRYALRELRHAFGTNMGKWVEAGLEKQWHEFVAEIDKMLLSLDAEEAAP